MRRRLLLIAALGAIFSTATFAGLASSSADASRPVGNLLDNPDDMYALVRQFDGDLYKDGHQAMRPDGTYRVNMTGVAKVFRQKLGAYRTVGGLHMMSAAYPPEDMCDGCRFYPAAGEHCFHPNDWGHCVTPQGQPGICHCTGCEYNDYGELLHCYWAWAYPCF